MKRIFLILGLLTLGSFSLMAGPCSTTMNLTQLTGLASTGCEFAGYNFSDFNITGYIDLATTASNGYNFVVHNTPGDNAKDNYLVTFSSPTSTSFQLAFTGAVAQTDGRGAWSLDTAGSTDASSNFGFTISYHINSIVGQGDVGDLHHATSAILGVVYSGAPGADVSTALTKSVRDGNLANLQTIGAKLTANSGDVTKSMQLTTNNTETIVVNDVFLEKITNVANAHLTSPTLINAFDTPEPMTFGLVGLGLAGLAFMRRRRA